MALTKEQILAANDLKTVVVDMSKEWGGDVIIRELSLKDRIYLEDLAEKDPNANFTISMLLMTCVDENGNKLFTQEDLDALCDKNIDAVMKLFKEIKILCKLDRTQDDIAKN